MVMRGHAFAAAGATVSTVQGHPVWPGGGGGRLASRPGGERGTVAGESGSVIGLDPAKSFYPASENIPSRL
jgi:hypothetical protein